MMKNRIRLTFYWSLLFSLILNSCAGIPGQSTPTPFIPTPTFLQQTAPPAVIETDPPLGSVIGHRSPITFYFNHAMNKASVEASFGGLPTGTFTWMDEATLVFNPAESFPPNTELKITLANSIQSATGLGITEPIELQFTVADFLRATNLLPKPDAADVNVDAAIVASFNLPVVALGGDASFQPAAFTIQPSVPGRGEWINTSTYIFYPESSMAGGTEYIVTVNPALKTATGVGVEGGASPTWRFVTSAGAADPPERKRQFTLCLSCGPIGVPDDPRKALGWASQFGFEAIEPSPTFLAKLSEAELEAYLGEMKAKQLTWGAAGLSVQFRGEETAFEQGMKSLPESARSLQRAGVTRVATWLTPGHRSLTYLANFRQHARRLREVARVLGDHGLRLGLEYVGPKTSWTASRFPFIHTMAEMKDLIAEIGRDNVGFLLDSWHW